MQSRDRDAAALWDMAEAIREIQHFMADVSEVEYLETLLRIAGVRPGLKQFGMNGVKYPFPP